MGRSALSGLRGLWGVVVLTLAILMSTEANPETYVAGYVGASIPQGLTDVNIMSPHDRRLSDLDLKNSLAYGAKIGYFGESAKWLGVETEIFRTSPHLSQQPVTTATVSTGSTSVADEPGASLVVTTWALNVVVRYPGQRLQPYVGIGPGLFFAQLLSDSAASTFGEAQAVNIGLSTQVGLRYVWSSKMFLFGEWKYNHVRLSFDSFPNASYNANQMIFGLGYQFR